MTRSTAIALALLVLSSLLALAPYCTKGLPLTYDVYHRLNRLAKYYVALHEGQFPPRWIGGVDKGVGSPIFVYLYPLPYITASLFHMAGMNLIDSLRTLYFIGYLGSTAAMFFFLKSGFTTRVALAGTLMYQWAPYRLVQLYIRGAPEEMVGYALLPLIFLGLLHVVKRSRGAWVFFGISLGFLFLMISTVGVMAMPLVASTIIVSFFFTRNRRVLFDSMKGCVLAFFVSGMTMIPNLFERSYIQFEHINRIYERNFLQVYALFSSPWTFVPTPQEIGFVPIGIYLCALGLLVWQTRDHGWRRNNSTMWWHGVLWLFAAWTFLYIVIAVEHPASRYLWRTVDSIKIIYAPVLFLGVIAFCVSTLAAFVFTRVVGVSVMALVLSAMFLYNIPRAKAESYIFEHDANLYSMDAVATGFDEFLPRNAAKHGDLFTADEPLMPLSESTRYVVLEKKFHRWTFLVHARTNDQVIIHQLYFPGWMAYVDGRAVPLSYTRPDEDVEVAKRTLDKGLMLVSLPSGSSTLVLRYEKTIGQRVGELMTASGILFVLGYVVTRREFLYGSFKRMLHAIRKTLV